MKTPAGGDTGTHEHTYGSWQRAEWMRLSSRACCTGRTDLLLRFFHSEFFDEWIAVSYLWKTRAEVRVCFTLLGATQIATCFPSARQGALSARGVSTSHNRAWN